MVDPRVVGAGAVHGPPRGERGQGLLWRGVLLAGEKITGRQDGADGAGAQPPRDEDVQPSQVLHQLDAGLRDLQVGAVISTAAAGNAVVAGSGGDDDDHPVPADHQQPFQVSHHRRQRNFMDDDELARDVIEAVFLLCYGRKLALTVRAAETGVVQAVYHHWSSGWKGATELRNIFRTYT